MNNIREEAKVSSAGNISGYTFLTLVIFFNFISMLVLLAQADDISHPVNNIFVMIMATMAVCEIFFTIFIVQLKKWALFSYIILAGVLLVIGLIQLSYFTIIVRAFLLLLLFREDWEKFR